MISHKHKCIFVHIQRCAGTSMEEKILGYDVWKSPHLINEIPEMYAKHANASQLKALYPEYWDEYFKFSFVRNPWERMVSMAKSYGGHYNVKINDDKLNVSGYKKKFGFPLTVEYDRRFSQRFLGGGNISPRNPEKHTEGTVYENILDEKIDFIGKIENLQEDFSYVADKIGLSDSNLNIHNENKKHKYGGHNFQYYYTEECIKEVETIYKKDIIKYNYKFL